MNSLQTAPEQQTSDEPCATCGRAYEAGKQDGLRKAWNAVSSLIRFGDLGGNGWDKNAERNGIILAANLLAEQMSAQGMEFGPPEMAKELRHEP